MSNWIYLEIAIGLVLVYFIVSLLCSTLTDWIGRWLALRARTLKSGVMQLINGDKKLYSEILGHSLFKGLSPAGDGTPHEWDLWHLGKWYIFKKNHYGPSEIPPPVFSKIIFDTIIDAGKKRGSGYQTADISINKLARSSKQADSSSLAEESLNMIKTLENNLVIKDEKVEVNDKQPSVDGIVSVISNDNKLLLKSLLAEAKTKANSWESVLKEFRASLEKWFDDSMQRLTGWYKRKTQLIVLVLALIVCFSLNIDSFGIAAALYNNPELREYVVTTAIAKAADNTSLQTDAVSYTEVKTQLDSLSLPIGWNTKTGRGNAIPSGAAGWLLKFAGILVTAFAASLGSSFWYDLLKKLVNIRAAGATPNKNGDKAANSSPG
jgi:hypothetical protein